MPIRELEKEKLIKNRSFRLAVSVVKICKELIDKREFVMSRQLLRSATSVGAMMREAEHAESKKDFIHKSAIAQKELNETLYWLELLSACKMIDPENYEVLHKEAGQMMRMIIRIIKTAKQNLNG